MKKLLEQCIETGLIQAINTSNAACIIVADNMDIIEFNQIAEKFFGWPRNFVLQKNFSSLCRNHYIPCFLEAQKNNVNSTEEETQLGKIEINNLLDESYAIDWAAIRVKQFKNHQNVILLYGKDITQSVRKKKEKESLFQLDSILQPSITNSIISDLPNASYNTLISIVEFLPGCVYMKDLNGVYIGCNDYLIKDIGGLKNRGELLGYSDVQLRDAVGNRWTDEFLHSIQSDDRSVMIKQNPLINKLETPFLDSSGKVVLQHSSKIPMKDEYGNVIGLFGISLDKAAELELNTLRNLYKHLCSDPRVAHEYFIKYFFGEEFVKQHNISDREFDCLQSLAQGKSLKEIATTFNISARTVETHITHMREKLSCFSTSQLINLFQSKSSLIKKNNTA